MPEDFYDRVAKKLGGYGYGVNPEYTKEFPAGDPEKIFKEKLLELSSKDEIALDIGCADGKFTISVAPYFKKVYGIDTSKVNLGIAESHSNDARSKNVEYSFQYASHTSFSDSFFDLAYCRRGPSFYGEYQRILKPGGYYLEIGIGEKDSAELKKVFGRGQGYGKWNEPRLDRDLKELKELGFKIIFAENYYPSEYYPSYEQFDLFLQGVPIFEDYNSVKDKAKLEEYVAENTTPKGIILPRHRIVLVAKKK